MTAETTRRRTRIVLMDASAVVAAVTTREFRIARIPIIGIVPSSVCVITAARVASRFEVPRRTACTERLIVAAHAVTAAMVFCCTEPDVVITAVIAEEAITILLACFTFAAAIDVTADTVRRAALIVLSTAAGEEVADRVVETVLTTIPVKPEAALTVRRNTLIADSVAVGDVAADQVFEIRRVIVAVIVVAAA